MIAAACLFCAGCLIGIYFRPAAIAAFSCLATLFFAVVWIARGEVTGFSLLIWLAYMTATQAGYLIGSYVTAQMTAVAAEPDASPEPDRRSAQP